MVLIVRGQPCIIKIMCGSTVACIVQCNSECCCSSRNTEEEAVTRKETPLLPADADQHAYDFSHVTEERRWVQVGSREGPGR